MKTKGPLHSETRIAINAVNEVLTAITSYNSAHGRLPDKAELLDLVLPSMSTYMQSERTYYIGEFVAVVLDAFIDYIRSRPPIELPDNRGW